MSDATHPLAALATAANDALGEASVAMAKYPAYNSAHEGYGVLAEEFSELEVHVFMKQENRDLAKMRHEAIQVAAVALRIAAELCTEDRGRR